MDFKSHAKNVLKNNFCSLTASRMIVVDFLNVVKKPANPYEIAADLNKSGKKIDVVTIYRILKLFENLCLVHKINDRYSRCQDYACMDQTHCHHQFVCQKCDQIKEVHFNDAEFLKKIGMQFKDLLINSHNFQFFGFCEGCRE